MNKLILALVAVCAAGSTQAAAAAQAAPQGQAAIPFVDYGGITDWRVTPEGDLLLRSIGANFYRAQFMGTCPNLKFAKRLGFDSGGGGFLDSLDKASVIYVDGQACPLRSLTRVSKAVWSSTK